MVGALDPGDQLRAGPRQGHARHRARRDRASRPASGSSSASAAPATRSTTSHIAARRIFWVAACAGIIVFGSLMAAMFIGQQFLQNVLGYDRSRPGAAILPAAFCMVIVAPRSAKLVEAQGARFTLLFGYVLLPARVPHDAAPVGRGASRTGRSGWRTRFVGVGVGFAGTPASHSLTGSVPVKRAGHGVGHRRPPARPRRRDHAVDPRRAAHRRYAAAAAAAIGASPNAQQVTRQRLRPSSRSRSRAPRRWASSIRSTRARSPRPPRPRSSTAPTGRTRRGSWRSCSVRRSSSSSSRSDDDEQRLLAEYHVADTTGAMGATGVATTA